MFPSHVDSAKSVSPQKPKDSTKTRIDNLVERIRSDFLQGGKPESTVYPTSDLSIGDVELIERRLIQQGLRLRFSWNGYDRQLHLKMPAPLHESFNTYMGRILPELNTQVATQTEDACTHYRVDQYGNASLRVGRLGQDGVIPPTVVAYDILQPDQSLQLTNTDLGEEHQNSYPVLVVEVAHSQALWEALLKAWKYLYASEKKIHTVIVYRLSYPVDLKKTFKAEIAVWVRSGEDATSYFPCSAEPYDAHSDTGSHRGSVKSEATTVVEGKRDRDLHAQTSWDQGSYAPPGLTDPMVLRGSSVVVLDETIIDRPSSLDPLVMRLSDIIPPCPDHPLEGGERTIVLDMNELRTVTEQRLRSVRRVQVSNAEAMGRSEEHKRKAEEEGEGEGEGGGEGEGKADRSEHADKPGQSEGQPTARAERALKRSKQRDASPTGST